MKPGSKQKELSKDFSKFVCFQFCFVWFAQLCHRNRFLLLISMYFVGRSRQSRQSMLIRKKRRMKKSPRRRRQEGPSVDAAVRLESYT